jgi:cytochrome c553
MPSHCFTGHVFRIAIIVASVLLVATPPLYAESEAAISTDADQTLPGAALYRERCAACHEQPTGRVPPRVTMLPLTPEYVERILSTGTMKAQAAGLTGEQIRSLATFVTHKPFGANAEPDPKANLCKRSTSVRPTSHDWSSWGVDYGNSRYQREPGLTATSVPRLRVKWVFAYPGRGTYAQPTVAGDRLFVPTVVGSVFSLDAASGCTHWSYDADAGRQDGGRHRAIEGGTQRHGCILWRRARRRLRGRCRNRACTLEAARRRSSPRARDRGADDLRGSALCTAGLAGGTRQP